MVENETTFVRSILVLCSTEEVDAGNYSCFADNTVGNDTASFMLTVNAQSKEQCNTTQCNVEYTGKPHPWVPIALPGLSLSLALQTLYH